MRKLLPFLGAFVFLLQAQPVRAEDDCTTVRLDRNGGPLEGLPVRSQGNLGICYAYVASTLEAAWMKKAGRPRAPVSPLYLSIVHSMDSSEKLRKCPDPKGKGKLELMVEGGTVCDTLESASKTWGCPDLAVNSALNAGMDSRGITPPIRKESDEAEKQVNRTVGILASQEKGLAQARERLKVSPSPEERVGLVSWIRETEKIYQSNKGVLETQRADLERLRAKSPSEDTDSIRSLYDDTALQNRCLKKPKCPPDPAPALLDQKRSIEDILKGTLTDFKDKLDQGGCSSNQQKVCRLSCDGVSNSNLFTSIPKTIKKRLSGENPMPMGLSLCSAAFASPDTRTVWDMERAADPAIPPLPAADKPFPESHPFCGPHAVVIVGRQRNPETGRCQLVLRNTWGSNCKRQEVCKSSHCSCEPGTGQLLMDEDIVYGSALEVQTIDPPAGEQLNGKCTK